jgi:hypothetical protein
VAFQAAGVLLLLLFARRLETIVVKEKSRSPESAEWFVPAVLLALQYYGITVMVAIIIPVL